MATVHEIEQRLFSWAPRESAMDWDNVGHLVGDPEQEVERILVALDITERVVQEAIDCGAQLIVSHHPVMNVRWHEREMQTLRPDTRLGGVLTTLVKNDISAICMHTNLDAADGGVNDCLAKKLGLNDIFLLNDEKIGRIGTLSCEKGLEEFLRDVIELLGCGGLRYCRGKHSAEEYAAEYEPAAVQSAAAGVEGVNAEKVARGCSYVKGGKRRNGKYVFCEKCAGNNGKSRPKEHIAHRPFVHRRIGKRNICPKQIRCRQRKHAAYRPKHAGFIGAGCRNGVYEQPRAGQAEYQPRLQVPYIAAEPYAGYQYNYYACQYYGLCFFAVFHAVFLPFRITSSPA